MNKSLIEILREIANSGIREKCFILFDNKRTELGEFIEEHSKDYLCKLKAEEVRHNDLFMEYEIKVKEIKDECK